MTVSCALVPFVAPPSETLRARRAALAELEVRLGELEREHERAKSELREFEKRFRPAVGARYDELQELKAKIARLRSEPMTDEERPRPCGCEQRREPFRPNDELKNLFRGLARRVHPDLAPDPGERGRRHEFMAEATRAYRAGDARRLQWLLEHWEASGAELNAAERESEEARLNRRIAWLRYRGREMNAALAALYASSMAEIMSRAKQARREGRNLIVEMRRSVAKELEQARAEYEELSRARAQA